MNLNAEKCEFLITDHFFEHLCLNIGETQVWQKNQVKLLGIAIDSELKFDDHIKKTCRKANSKLSTLSRLARYLSMKQKKAHFKYCPITWMFCRRSCNNKINKLQERTLRLVYDDYESSFFFFFFYGNEHYTLNIKSTVTWHHDFYGCQGYKKSNN